MFETRTEIKKKSSKNILIFTKFTLIYPHGVLFYLVLYVYANFVIFIIKKNKIGFAETYLNQRQAK